MKLKEHWASQSPHPAEFLAGFEFARSVARETISKCAERSIQDDSDCARARREQLRQDADICLTLGEEEVLWTYP